MSSRNRWVVNVPAVLSDTGKRRQLFFEKKGGAQALCEELKIRQEIFGRSLSYMTPARIAEAGEAYKILAPLKASLLDAARAFVVAHQARHASVTFLTLFNEFLEAKHDRHPRYLQELRITLNRMPEIHDRIVSDIAPREIEAILRPLTPGARNPVMRYPPDPVRINRQGSDGIILRVVRVAGMKRRIRTIPIEQVSRMLNHALEHDLGLLPFLTLGFFCGVRPENELMKLEWSDLKQGEIVVRPEVSKTNRRRFVDISPNAQAWLDSYADRGGVTTGKVVRYTLPTVQRRHRALRKAVGIARWPQQGARHTFCSNWLASHHDEPADIESSRFHRHDVAGVPQRRNPCRSESVLGYSATGDRRTKGHPFASVINLQLATSSLSAAPQPSVVHTLHRSSLRRTPAPLSEVSGGVWCQLAYLASPVSNHREARS